MNKHELIATLRNKRAEWDNLLKQFPSQIWTKAGVDGSQSLKDLVAHVNWYERQTVGMLLAQAMVGSKLWDLSLEQRNAAIYSENKDRPLEAIQADALRIFPSLIAAIEGLGDAELNDPKAFTNWPESWIPWQVIASNTYEHYQQHIPGIQTWLKTTRTKG